MADNRDDHGLMVSLNVLLLSIVGLALLAYQVSPLRDPSFIPQAVNAGATVSWLNPEKYWTTAVRFLSVALATNLTLIAWTNWQPLRHNNFQGIRKLITIAIKGLALGGLWIVVFYSAWYFFLAFLLWQHIVD